MRRRVYINRPRNPDTSGIDRINELSRISRTNWFSLLAYLAFAGVTLLGVQDADFFIEGRQTTLPLVSVEIPTRDFFIFGPFLGTALFVYLHLYLLKLWDALAVPPPRSKGEALSQQVTPWLINDLGLALRGDGAVLRRPLDWLSHIVTFLLVFAVGPFVVGYFWVRYWPAHEMGFSIFNALLFVLATMTMVVSLFTAVTRLRYGWKNQSGTRHLIALVTVLIISLPAITLTVAKTDGPERLGILRTSVEISYSKAYRALVWIGVVDEQYGNNTGSDPYALKIASADLREVEFVTLPADWLFYDAHRQQFRVQWCERQGLDLKSCGPSKSGGDLETYHSTARTKWCNDNGYGSISKCSDFFLSLEKKFDEAWKYERQSKISALENWSPRNLDFRNADMWAAQLAGADLRSAQLEGAYLRGANMEGADFSYAKMEGVDLRRAWLRGADMFYAQMQKANLIDAKMEDAVLRGAKLEGANLSQAKLTKANLSFAQLEKAILVDAQMEGVVLDGAKLEGAVFLGANLKDVDLSRAKIGTTVLSRANMTSVEWSDKKIWAPAHHSDLRGSIGLTQDQLMSLIGNWYTLLPDQPNPDTGKPLFIPSCWVTEPESWNTLVETSDKLTPESALRAQFLCPSGTVPQKSGTPWPLDKTPPWEDNPNWKPVYQGSVTASTNTVE